MSIHAFFNVVENLIRNSAKYCKGDLTQSELVFTIRINEQQADKAKNIPESYEFIIFDNKANALKPYLGNDGTSTTLLDKMKREMASLKILTDGNTLVKSNKGLKEMLFSTLWMRAYTYDKAEYMSDILAKMDRLASEEKLDEIRQHAFEYVAVDNKGHEVRAGGPANLGIRFCLPKYRMMENVSTGELDNNISEKALNNFTDIVCVDVGYTGIDRLRTQFTRVYSGKASDEDSATEAVTILKEVLGRRFSNFDKYRLCIDSEKEDGFDESVKDGHGIYFETHLADIDKMNQYAYCEAVSGENFTKTMQNIFNNGISHGKYEDSPSEYFALKIKEAALTRITLLDERLYNDMQDHAGMGLILGIKNVRVLGLKEREKERQEGMEVEAFFDGNYFNYFKDGNFFKDESCSTHFLSIHLGMIEKIVKDDSAWIIAQKMGEAGLEERVDRLMEWLKEKFKTQGGEIFISIHSGRGSNFSKELENKLRSYPFISISALEAAYSNSKFLLAQLFYNTVYNMN